MEKVISHFGLVLGIVILLAFRSFATEYTHTLKTKQATLSINKNGNVQIVQNEGGNLIARSTIDDLWKITLVNRKDNSEYVISSVDDYSVKKEGNKICFAINSLSSGNQKFEVSAMFYISIKDDAFCFNGWLKNYNEDYLLKEIDYPRLSAIMPNIKKDRSVYWPAGLGEHFDNLEKLRTKSHWYPSVQGICMPWFSVNSENTGLYIGSHDSLQATKRFNLSYNKTDKALQASITIPLCINEFNIPDAKLWVYEGQWYSAAKYYRAWYDRHFHLYSAPGWVINNSGWLLAILKQQNGEVIWNYKDIDKLCEIATDFNLGTIGLFGWAAGGHDHLYPNFPPDNLMGGKEELKRAIKRAQEKGVKIVLYANAKILDTSTDFYKFHGIETILLKNNMKPDVQFYVKQKNATPVIFAQACCGSKLWRKTMIDLGIQAVELGADGILYDQLGVLKPDLCFSNHHDHRPGESDAAYRQLLLTEVNKKVKAINPEFIVMTESSTDVNIQSVDYFHGCGIGTAEYRKEFPELFRYTFPELVTTQRNANPMLTRTEANFAAIYGMRHEIEIRYPGDKNYILNNRVTKEDYANVVDPPNLDMVSLYNVEESAAYVNLLIEFMNEHADFFRRGRFIDQEGIDVSGQDIEAKGFLSDERMGVIVWNKNVLEKSAFQISVKNYHLLNISEPEVDNVEISSMLAPNSIRLLVFQRD